MCRSASYDMGFVRWLKLICESCTLAHAIMWELYIGSCYYVGIIHWLRVIKNKKGQPYTYYFF